jgi:tRNA (guanine-N7-)-methyltransferase
VNGNVLQQTDDVRTFKTRRRTTPGQADALHRLLPALGLSPTGRIEPARVFGREAPLVLEIGSGMGEATAAMAAADPDRDVLAVDVHTPGIANLLRLVEEAGLRNVRVLEGDARALLRDRLAPGALDEVRVFFPDPWPKARHAKRRLVSPAFAGLVAARLRPDGRLHVATDWASYAAHTSRVLHAHPSFDVVSTDRGDRPVTRFERRGVSAGRPAHDLVARRR